MTPPILTELAERVQALTEACRETDILIGYAVDLKGDDKFLSFRRSFDICGMEQMLQMAESHQNIWRHELPRYTASLDAAMTLVPEGLPILVRDGYDDAPGDSRPYAHIMNEIGEGYAATKALAIVVASLRARAALESSHE